MTKLTTNQRNQLLQIYLHMGVNEAQRMCLEYGVHYRYAEKQAFEFGFGVRTKRRNASKPRKHMPYVIDHDDPRWERAKAIGPIFV